MHNVLLDKSRFVKLDANYQRLVAKDILHVNVKVVARTLIENVEELRNSETHVVMVN